MLPRSADTDTFWQAFRLYAGLDHDNYVVGSFGDSPEMATELADLVIAGIKRDTASLARDYGEGGEPTPRFSDFVIMPDGEGRPRLIWRTTEVTIKPLSEVDEAFAWDEGEGNRTRDWWLDAHRRYFARQARREGLSSTTTSRPCSSADSVTTLPPLSADDYRPGERQVILRTIAYPN
jgi:uncharacterized protein YhfF